MELQYYENTNWFYSYDGIDEKHDIWKVIFYDFTFKLKKIRSIELRSIWITKQLSICSI